MRSFLKTAPFFSIAASSVMSYLLALEDQRGAA
jgi:hypothetical protein